MCSSDLLGCDKVEIVPRRIDRLPDADKLEMRRKEALQILRILEFILMKLKALLTRFVPQDCVTAEDAVHLEAFNNLCDNCVYPLLGEMINRAIPDNIVK